jgi:hypothetical protein
MTPGVTHPLWRPVVSTRLNRGSRPVMATQSATRPMSTSAIRPRLVRKSAAVQFAPALTGDSPYAPAEVVSVPVGATAAVVVLDVDVGAVVCEVVVVEVGVVVVVDVGDVVCEVVVVEVGDVVVVVDVGDVVCEVVVVEVGDVVVVVDVGDVVVVVVGVETGT